MSTRTLTFEPFGRPVTAEVIATRLTTVGNCRSELTHTVRIGSCPTPFNVRESDVLDRSDN